VATAAATPPARPAKASLNQSARDRRTGRRREAVGTDEQRAVSDRQGRQQRREL
jgi:hypothetical protein